jgi:TetR/AcrR family transcriptional regulator, regulator of autoinduction and epiphytic fitness
MPARVKRRYDATGRQEQARQNRRRIIGAAVSLFAARGYAGTSLAEVASAAGVAVQTVYAAFGTKVNLLKHAIDVSLAGDDAPVPMMDRDAVRQMMAEPDPYRVLARYAAQVRAVTERAAGVMLAAWAAAPGDPAVAALVANLDAQRLRGMTALAASIAAKARQAGCLADGITEEDIRDALWAFNSPQLTSLLLRDRGWSPDRFEAWLARSWTRLLLDPR